MAFDLTTLGLAFLAGVLSLLSPCVLPIAPIVLGTAVNAHPRGHWALLAGLSLSFVVVGTLIAWAANQFGFDPGVLQIVGAVLLGVLGVVLVFAPLQERLAGASSGLSQISNGWLDRLSPEGLGGQFVVGLVLGLVWSPCVGPTLGAAIVLASQGKDLGPIALVMLAFSLGAALPLLILARLSRAVLGRVRGKLLSVGKIGKIIMGVLMIVISLLMLTGGIHVIGAALTAIMPQWLVELVTRY